MHLMQKQTHKSILKIYILVLGTQEYRHFETVNHHIALVQKNKDYWKKVDNWKKVDFLIPFVYVYIYNRTSVRLVVR